MFSGFGLVGTYAISIFSTRFYAFCTLFAPPPDPVYDVFNLLLLFYVAAMGGFLEAEF